MTIFSLIALCNNDDYYFEVADDNKKIVQLKILEDEFNKIIDNKEINENNNLKDLFKNLYKYGTFNKTINKNSINENSINKDVIFKIIHPKDNYEKNKKLYNLEDDEIKDNELYIVEPKKINESLKKFDEEVLFYKLKFRNYSKNKYFIGIINDENDGEWKWFNVNSDDIDYVSDIKDATKFYIRCEQYSINKQAICVPGTECPGDSNCKRASYWVGNFDDPLLKGRCTLPEVEKEKKTQKVNILNNHYWKDKECWNDKLESAEPSAITIELGGSRPNFYQYGSAYKKYGPFNGEESRDNVIVHACESPQYPYSNYNEAAAKYNKKKLDGYVQDTYFKRNPVLMKQNEETYDRQAVATERIRLKEEQRVGLSKFVNIFGILYYIFLLIIVVRIARFTSLFSLETSSETILFIIIVVMLGALPFGAEHLARHSYGFFQKEGFSVRSLFTPSEHHDIDSQAGPNKLIRGQNNAISQIESEGCYTQLKHSEKDGWISIYVNSEITKEHNINSRTKCEDAHKKREQDLETEKDYCWGTKESCSDYTY